ncbi:hypothetical protein G6O67_002967 [Ophiocordyceps sinensis]|uniref:NAD(P)-binding protein n=1 Tax=Ophiocordyceps sinensis TaxID=72228 RepID=A0A8H4V843_9HYPO|nr:hypothetical protein G6O67_002967 [Ophiocordyceps sinensis]
MTGPSASKSVSNLTTTLHREPYAAIDPSRPELSQRRQTVLITGSSGGTGYAIARSFAKAGAATVILTGRQERPLAEAAKALKAQYPKTTFIDKKLDIANSGAAKDLWGGFHAEGLVVDVLVLNAARAQAVNATMLELGYKEVMADFAVNVGANMEFADYFYHQKKRDASKKLSMVNVSTSLIHDFDTMGMWPNYSASKNAGTMVMQQIAKDVSASDMQVISFHPGVIFTPSARNAGLSKEAVDWDDGKHSLLLCWDRC